MSHLVICDMIRSAIYLFAVFSESSLKTWFRRSLPRAFLGLTIGVPFEDRESLATVASRPYFRLLLKPITILIDVGWVHEALLQWMF